MIDVPTDEELKALKAEHAEKKQKYRISARNTHGGVAETTPPHILPCSHNPLKTQGFADLIPILPFEKAR